MNLKSLPDILFFWISIALISFASGFIGGAFRPDDALIVVPDAKRETVILEDRVRGEEAEQKRLSTIIAEQSQSMLAVYQWQPTRKGLNVASLPVEDDFVTYALAVTSDGWLLTSKPLDGLPSSYTVVRSDGDQLSVKQIVRDESAGYTFLRTETKNLRPIEFASFDDPLGVQDAYLIRDPQSIEHISISAPREPPVTTAREWISHSTTLTKVHNPEESYTPTCMPVVRDERVVIGCTLEKGIQTFRYLQRSLSDLLRKGTIERHTLDIPTVDLSVTPIPLHQRLRSGARVTLENGGSMALAGVDGSMLRLKDGDIIVSVNEESIDRNRTLAELLGQYAPGDTITFRIVPGAGEEKEFRFILK